jgi:hypothetical protein
MRRIALLLPWLAACGGGAVIAPKPSDESKPTPASSSSASITAAASASSSGPTPPSPTLLEAHATLGPFSKLADGCKALAAAAKGAKAFLCLPGPNIAPPPPGSPIDRAMVLSLSDKSIPDASSLHLGLHTKAGWYVDPDGPESHTEVASTKRYRTDVLPAGETFFTKGLSGASWAVRYDFAEVTYVVTPDTAKAKSSTGKFHSVRDAMVLCGLGASGAPRCFGPIRTDLELAAKDGTVPPAPNMVLLEAYSLRFE